MYSQTITFLTGVSLLLMSCETQEHHQIAQPLDYNIYLNTSVQTATSKAIEEYGFWFEKLEQNKGQYPYLGKMASANTALFNLSGDVKNLLEAEKELLKANEVTQFESASYLRMLASNYISQHKFPHALKLLQKAEQIGENLVSTQKMLFDAHLELGNNEMAGRYLMKFKDDNDFDFLIRMAKWKDHEGQLSDAIRYLEQACTIAENAKSESLMLWSYTNLADFYGHDGQIKKAYDHYLMALELNPNEAYAKKGLAWIAYANDDNPDEALRILDSIMLDYQSPDYHLLRAEIAEYKGDVKMKEKELSNYLEAVASEDYGHMYNSFSSSLYAEELSKYNEAISLAEAEVQLRPTPMSYDLLAWSYYQKGDIKKAQSIASQHVENKSFEPVCIYHLASIYKALGDENKAKILKKELAGSEFELGPLMAAKIQKL